MTTAAPPPVIASSPSLGMAEGRCRENESGPAVIVTVVGLKDRKGQLRVELYPPTEGDFLQDDNILVSAGKTFRRVEVPVAQTGPARACIRVPGPGTYTLSVHHDRNDDRRFQLSIDGIGFSGNPRIGHSQPKADVARFAAGPGLTPITIVMNYRSGLFSIAPLKDPKP